MKQFFLLITVLITFAFAAQAQNCGQIIDFTVNAVNNGNGTSTYNFSVVIQATSGGSKSVLLTIACPGHNFVVNDCKESMSVTRTVYYGPYTITTCTGPVELTWSGHTNATCGGTTCNSQQVFANSNLPVELSSFTVNILSKEVLLKWVTQSEINNELFVLERSKDGHDFLPIGKVSGHGTTYERQTYQFTDHHPMKGTNYYRLKQVDFDGNFMYSAMISAEIEWQSGQIFPNPNNGHFSLTGIGNEDAVLVVMNLNGKKVYEKALSGDSHAITLPSLPKGMYLVNVISRNRVLTDRIILE